MNSGEFEFLDPAPEGYVHSASGDFLRTLGVPVILRRWQQGTFQGNDKYVPEWAERLRVASDKALHLEGISHLSAIQTLCKLPFDLRSAAVSVYDLGGIDALSEYLRAAEHAR